MLVFKRLAFMALNVSAKTQKLLGIYISCGGKVVGWMKI